MSIKFDAQGPAAEADFYQGLDNPPELRSWREKLFSVSTKLIFSKEEYDTYWLYASNIWSIATAKRQRADGVTVVHYNCRYKRET